MSKEGMISNRQLQALALVNSFGILSVSIPLGATILSGAASWLFVAIGGVITAAVMAMAVECRWVYPWLMQTKAGNVVALVICAKIILCGGIWLRLFSEAMNQLLLPKTSSWIISIMMLIVAFYAAYKGVETRGRFAEIAFGIIFVALIFIFLLSAQNVKIDNLKPFRLAGGAKACVYTVTAAFGIEYLFFISHYINGEKKGKSAFTAGIAGAVLLTAVVAFTVGVFGVGGVVERRWAVLQIMDTIDFPLMLLERQDVLMMGFWITSIFAFINGAVFYSGHILGKVAVKKSNDMAMLIAAVALIFIVSILPQNMVSAQEMMEKTKLLNFMVEIGAVAAYFYGRRCSK